MKKYELLLSNHAVKQFHQLEKKLQERIKKALCKLEQDPFNKRSGCDIKELHRNKSPKYSRLRVGDYRIIFTIQKRKIKITEILHRKKAYEFLE